MGIRAFFSAVAEGKTDAVIKLLGGLPDDTTRRLLNGESLTDIQKSQTKCHPLCTCSSCTRLTLKRQQDPSSVTVYSRDADGCTVGEKQTDKKQNKKEI